MVKKIWEITSTSNNYALKVQAKRNVIVIRPVNWISQRSKYKPFTKKEDFILALYKTLCSYTKTEINKDIWLREVINNYFEHTGDILSIDSASAASE